MRRPLTTIEQAQKQRYFAEHKEQKSKAIKAHGKPPEPTPYKIPLGIDTDGNIRTLKVYENHLLIAGDTGSGKSYTANRILKYLIQIPQELRFISIIDLKSGQESAKWRDCIDAEGYSIEYADRILTNIYIEMTRRGRMIHDNPRKYRDSKIKPSKDNPLLIVWIDELAALMRQADDKDTEQVRKHAVSMLDKLLFLGRSVGVVVIVCIQRADSSLGPNFAYMKDQLKTKISGRLGSKGGTTTVFGQGMEDRYPAHELKNFWFICKADGSDGFTFKTPGKDNDEDLWEVIENPIYHVDRERGKWLYDLSKGKNTKTNNDTNNDEHKKKKSKQTTKNKKQQPKQEKQAKEEPSTKDSFTPPSVHKKTPNKQQSNRRQARQNLNDLF